MLPQLYAPNCCLHEKQRRLRRREKLREQCAKKASVRETRARVEAANYEAVRRRSARTSSRLCWRTVGKTLTVVRRSVAVLLLLLPEISIEYSLAYHVCVFQVAMVCECWRCVALR